MSWIIISYYYITRYTNLSDPRDVDPAKQRPHSPCLNLIQHAIIFQCRQFFESTRALPTQRQFIDSTHELSRFPSGCGSSSQKSKVSHI